MAKQDQVKIAQYGEKRVEHFGVRDAKGREIGGRAALLIGTNSHVERPHTIETTLMPEGTVYGYTPHAMRDGKLFGAIQGYSWFATEAERDAAVSKYFTGARKRAAKIAG